MFSSLASFLFGLNTNCETNSETTATASATGVGEESNKRSTVFVDADHLIEVTSLTPSIAGAGERAQGAIKRGKTKRNNVRQQTQKRNEVKTPLSLNLKQAKVQSSPNSSDEGEFDDGDWFIVEKEEIERNDLPILNDSEEENVPINELVKINKVLNSTGQQRRQQHNSLHSSSYGGPRPQKQRNFLQKSRNNNQNNRPTNGLSVTTLSPSRTVNDGCPGSKNEAPADGGVSSRAVCCMAAPKSHEHDEERALMAINDFEALNSMDESWFVTPPPCFTSIGPVNMETSPYENLLIEHPSMSVYHSIRMAQEATDNFVKLDISVNELAEKQQVEEPPTPKKKPQAVQPPRNTALVCRLDRHTATQMKQEFLARNMQKIQTKHELQDKSRSAYMRANKARDVQSRNHIQRRSDRQYSKICSNASNNRKTNCY